MRYTLPPSGFEILPALSEQTVRLLDEIQTTQPNLPCIIPGFQSTIYSADIKQREITSGQILSAAWPELSTHIVGYRPLFATFVTKYPDRLGTVGLHDDWTFTSESEYDSINIWIPLQNTTVENGGYSVVPSSHLWGFTLRNVGFPFRFAGSEELLLSYLKPIDLNTGQPLVYHCGLLHATPPNLTNQVRRALTITCIPAEAPAYYYYRPNQDKTVQEWHVADNFFTQCQLGQAPTIHQGILLREFEFDFPLLSHEQLEYHLASVEQLNLYTGLQTGRSESELPVELLNPKHSTPMRTIFLDTANEEQFRKDGFLIVEGFFNPTEVDNLRTLYASVPDPLQGFQFHTTLFSPDPEYKRRIGKAIFDAYAPKIEGLLNNYKPLAANFIIKEPGDGSYLPLHLDWSMLDEQKYVTIAGWCTLTDLDDTNAPLGVYPGSHNAPLILRGSKSDDIPLFPDYTNPVLNAYRENYPEVLLKLKAGTAVLYDQRLAHYSPANVSPAIRLAMNAVYIPAEAQPLHYYQAPDKQIRVYSVQPDFYYTHQPGQEPKGNWEPLDADTMQLTSHQFEVQNGGTGYNFEAPVNQSPSNDLLEYEPLPPEPELGIPSSYEYHVQVSPLMQTFPRKQAKSTFWGKLRSILGI
jgi:ectoine hydroxylase-related dioxygenase (phytanoyl-CoA dioxygenase family)